MYTNIFCIISNCAIKQKERIGLLVRLVQVHVVFQRIAKGHFSAHNNLKEVEGSLACTYQGTFKHANIGCFALLINHFRVKINIKQRLYSFHLFCLQFYLV
jgi:hypothetical protein